MDSIIRKLITSQSTFISTDMMGAYARLAHMDLEELYSAVIQEKSSDQQVLSVVQTALSYGYIYNNLSKEEYSKLDNKLTRWKYDELRELLVLYNKLATILTDSLMTNSVVSKYGLLDEALSFSQSRDNLLEEIIYSSHIEASKNIKNELRKLHNNISIYKQANITYKFDEIIVPKVSDYVRNGYTLSGINMLYNYVLGKCEVKAGIDDKIKYTYNVIDNYIREINGRESNNYIRLSHNTDEIIKRYEENTKLLLKKKYY